MTKLYEFIHSNQSITDTKLCCNPIVHILSSIGLCTKSITLSAHILVIYFHSDQSVLTEIWYGDKMCLRCWKICWIKMSVLVSFSKSLICLSWVTNVNLRWKGFFLSKFKQIICLSWVTNVNSRWEFFLSKFKQIVDLYNDQIHPFPIF